MVFSLFGRKDKNDARRTRGGSLRIAENSLRGPATQPSVEAQRELARRTAEKIDRIESEMIDGPASIGRAEPATQPVGRAQVEQRRRLVPSEAQLAPAPAPELAPLEFESALPANAPAAAAGIEVSVSALPPDLEEAAILYANGQAKAAATTLRASIARGGADPGAQQAWRMLFDVLQALGQRAEFETVALDFAARFEKSPPAWQEQGSEARAPRRTLASANVVLPASLDARAQSQFETAQRNAANRRPVTLDFSAVRSVDPQGAALAVAAVAAFEKGGRELAVAGARELHQAARAAIETGRRDPGDACWQLCLLALRLLGDRQAFDDLSIDFCVTYEVSPPPWEPLADCIRVASADARAPAGPAEPTEQARGGEADGSVFALRGELAGRIAEEIAALRAWAGQRTEVRIDCSALRRLDFVAAGELLNEVAAMAGAGRRVIFLEPSAVVEALMVVMGLHELADIRRRRI